MATAEPLLSATGLWPVLARIGSRPAPAWRWKQLLGESPEVMPFLRSVAILADRVPCPHPCGCGQLHRVVQIEPNEFVAVPEADDCEPAPLFRHELAVFAADTARLAATIAATGRLAGDSPPLWLLGEREEARQPSPVLGARTASRRLGNTWPHARPENPAWRDVKLTLHSQEVAITFGPSQAKFDFRQIDGFTDQRGGKRPNRLWAILRAFALRDGVLPLPTKDEDPVRVRTLRELDTVLQRFFGLPTSAFAKLIEEQRVRCLFSVRAPD